MKKRLFSVFIALALLITMIPVFSLSANDHPTAGFTIDGDTVHFWGQGFTPYMDINIQPTPGQGIPILGHPVSSDGTFAVARPLPSLPGLAERGYLVFRVVDADNVNAILFNENQEPIAPGLPGGQPPPPDNQDTVNAEALRVTDLIAGKNPWAYDTTVQDVFDFVVAELGPNFTLLGVIGNLTYDGAASPRTITGSLEIEHSHGGPYNGNLYYANIIVDVELVDAPSLSEVIGFGTVTSLGGNLVERVISLNEAELGRPLEGLTVYIKFTFDVGGYMLRFVQEDAAANSITIRYSPTITSIVVIVSDGMPQMITDNPIHTGTLYAFNSTTVVE